MRISRLLCTLCLCAFVVNSASAQQLISDLQVQRTVRLGTHASGVVSPAEITADQNNYAPTGHAAAFVLRLTADEARTITGLAGGVAGRMLLLCNVGAEPITLANADTDSSEANRFALADDYTLEPGAACWLYYDGTSSRWRQPGGGGGGGGGGGEWGTITGTLSAQTDLQAELDDKVDEGAVTTSGLTMATARLLGRTTGSTGAIEEITVGSGLTLSGGELSASGGGGGGGSLTLARFTALDNQPPATNFATFHNRNNIAVLDFDADADEHAIFVGIIPEAADFTTGITARLHWMATSATSGDVVWVVAFERSNTDLDSDSFATGVSGTSTTNGTSGIVTVTSINFSGSEIDGVTAGDLFRVKVTRDADAGGDTMTGDAELIAVEIRQR
jgi:hypothetical protein